MKELLLLLVLLCGITATQAQKNKKQVNTAAAAAEDKEWKPTKGDTRNPFDTAKTKQVKTNGLGVGEDPFEKNGGKRKKTVTKKNGYANQEVSYARQPADSAKTNFKKPAKKAAGNAKAKAVNN